MISAPPRTVSWKLRLKWLRDRPVALLLGVFLVAVLPVLFPIHYWMLRRMERQLAGDFDYGALARHGKDASGEVTGVRADEIAAISGQRPWIVDYRFGANGREHRGSMKTLDKQTVGNWQVGQPVTVRYLGPESMITDVKPCEFSLWKIWIQGACGYIAIGLCFLLYAAAGMRKKVTLYRNGILTTGKISALEAQSWLNFLPAFQRRFRATYRFPDHEGKDHLGSSTSTNLALLNGAKQGDPVEVLFLESRPEINCLAEEHHLLALPDND